MGLSGWIKSQLRQYIYNKNDIFLMILVKFKEFSDYIFPASIEFLKSKSKRNELVLVFISQLVTFLGNALLVKLLTGVCSKNMYGLYSLSMSFMSIILLIPFNCFNQGVIRYTSIYNQEKNGLYNLFVSSIIVYSFVLAIYACLTFLCLKIFNVSEKWQELVFPLSLLIITSVFREIIISVEGALRNRKLVAANKIGEFTFKILILLLLFRFYSSDVGTILFVYSGYNILFIILYLIFHREYLNLFGLEKGAIKKFFHQAAAFGLPLLITAIPGWLQFQASKWLIDMYMTLSNVAAYSFSYSLAIIFPTSCVGVVGSFILPILYQKENDTPGYTSTIMKKLLPALVILFLSAVIFCSIFKDYIVVLFSSEKYLDASWMLPALMVGSCIQNLTLVCSYVFFARKKTKYLIVPNMLPGFISLGLGFLFIAKYQLVGIVSVNIISNLCYALLVLAILFCCKKKHIIH
jgi:O-antigen/teichoic acid export membrane protein